MVLGRQVWDEEPGRGEVQRAVLEPGEEEVPERALADELSPFELPEGVAARLPRVPCVGDVDALPGAIVDRAVERGTELFVPRSALPSPDEGSFYVADLVGHDAVYVTKVAPAGMIFLPCEGGISHNEIENATLEDLAAGCQVLLHAVLDKAGAR